MPLGSQAGLLWGWRELLAHPTMTPLCVFLPLATQSGYVSGPGSPDKCGPHQDHHSVVNSGFFVLSDSLSGIQKATGSTHPQQHRHKIGNSGCLNQFHAGVGLTKVRSCWIQSFKAFYPPEKWRCFLVAQPQRGSNYPFIGRREPEKQNPNPYPTPPTPTLPC